MDEIEATPSPMDDPDRISSPSWDVPDSEKIQANPLMAMKAKKKPKKKKGGDGGMAAVKRTKKVAKGDGRESKAATMKRLGIGGKGGKGGKRGSALSRMKGRAGGKKGRLGGKARRRMDSDSSDDEAGAPPPSSIGKRVRRMSITIANALTGKPRADANAESDAAESGASGAAPPSRARRLSMKIKSALGGEAAEAGVGGAASASVGAKAVSRVRRLSMSIKEAFTGKSAAAPGAVPQPVDPGVDIADAASAAAAEAVAIFAAELAAAGSADPWADDAERSESSTADATCPARSRVAPTACDGVKLSLTEGELVAKNWVKKVDKKSKKAYWANTVTKTTMWKTPKCVKAAQKAEAAGGDPAQGAAAADVQGGATQVGALSFFFFLVRRSLFFFLASCALGTHERRAAAAVPAAPTPSHSREYGLRRTSTSTSRHSRSRA
jgi:hypothetical protein